MRLTNVDGKGLVGRSGVRGHRNGGKGRIPPFHAEEIFEQPVRYRTPFSEGARG
jgi:hypothetical protein